MVPEPVQIQLTVQEPNLEPVKPETGETGNRQNRFSGSGGSNRTDLEPNQSESGFDETEPNRTEPRTSCIKRKLPGDRLGASGQEEPWYLFCFLGRFGPPLAQNLAHAGPILGPTLAHFLGQKCSKMR